MSSFCHTPYICRICYASGILLQVTCDLERNRNRPKMKNEPGLKLDNINELTDLFRHDVRQWQAATYFFHVLDIKPCFTIIVCLNILAFS